MLVGKPWLCEKRLSVIRCLVWQQELGVENWEQERESKQDVDEEPKPESCHVIEFSAFINAMYFPEATGLWDANEWQSYYVAANAAFLLLTYSACRRNQSVNKYRRGIAVERCGKLESGEIGEIGKIGFGPRFSGEQSQSQAQNVHTFAADFVVLRVCYSFTVCFLFVLCVLRIHMLCRRIISYG